MSEKELPNSESYKKALKLTQEFHAGQDKTFSGQFTWKKRKQIKEIINKYDIKTILDYGCGKGKQYDPERNRDEEGRTIEEFWEVETTKYDPGVPKYSMEPTGSFDLVICVQVLGSIPLLDLPKVVDRLYGFANKVVFVSERLALPHKRIYNEIAHLMPRGLSVEDWLKILHPREKGKKLVSTFRIDGAWFNYEVG